MAKISSYPILSTPTVNDLLIGTDVENLNETKNFSIGDIGSLIGQDYVPYVGATGNVNLGSFNIAASAFIVPGGLASQFLKADGSLDSTAYTPQARTLTINGTTYNLSANRSWDLNTIDTLTTTGTSGAATYIGKVLNIPVYQAQGTYITQLSGEATAVGPGNASVTLSNSAVISKVLTGLNVNGGTIVSTDTILQAFGKVQNQINGLTTGVTYQGVWNAATNVPFLQSSVGTQGYYYVVDVAGNTNLNGITDWQVGDWAIYNGTAWQKVDNTDAVVSVNGYVGAVVLTASDVGAAPTTRTLTINGVGYNLSADRSWTVGDVRTDGSYANPSWITSLAWSKITSTPTTLAGYGITDGALNSTTLTINGTTYDLTENRTWNVGTVTSVGTSGPLTGGTITGSGTIGITQSSSTTDGYLSSTDWNAFNSKQAAISVNAPLTFVAGVIGITQSGASTDGYLSSTDWNTFNSKVSGSGTANTLPMWGSASSLINSPLSYAADAFNFGYNSATGGTVNFTNIGLTTYTYSIQMNNFGSPRSTVHSYTDGLIIQSIGGTQVSRMFANGNFILGTGTVDNGYKLEITGNLYVSSIVNATVDTDRFIVSDSGIIKYRTGAELLSDLGVAGSFVPYTGATSAVDLGANDLTSRYLIANGSAGLGGVISMKQDAAYIAKGNGYSSIASSFNSFDFFGYTGASTYKNFQLRFDGLTNNTLRTYTLPDASGTIALVGGSGVGTVTSVSALTLGTSGTDLSSTVANGTTTPVITLNVPTASATNRGALSSSDWIIFNNKQSQLNGTGFVKASGTSITYDNSTYVTINTNESISGFKTFTSSITLSNSISNGFNFEIGSTGSFTSLKAKTSGGANIVTLPSSNGTIALTSDLSGYVQGSGTTNYLPKFTGSTTIGNSQIFDNGTNVGIGTASPVTLLHLNQASGTIALTLQTGSNFGYLFNDGTNIGLASNVGSTGLKFLVNRSAPDNSLSITSGGNLLVGTTTDNGARLQVSGTATVSSSLTAGSLISASATFSNFGSETAAVVAFADGNTGFFRPALNTLGITTAGTERMRITSAGNLLVGTTTDNGARLQVSGDQTINATQTYTLSLNNTAQDVRMQLQVNGTQTFQLSSSSSQVNIYGATNIPMIFYTNASERMRITSGGQVLIGQTAASGTTNGIYFRPGIESGFIVTSDVALQLGRLSTTGDIQTFYYGSTRVGKIAVGSTTVTFESATNGGLSIASTGAATFSSSVTATSETTDSSMIQQWGYSGNTSNYRLRLNTIVSSGLVKYSFDTLNSSTAYNNNLVLDRGNVGIGTTSPNANLEVATTNSLGSFAKFRLNAPYYNYWEFVNNSALEINRGGSTYLTISNVGNLLVGTTSDNGARLNVNGNVVASNYTTTSGSLSVPSSTYTTVFTFNNSDNMAGVFTVRFAFTNASTICFFTKTFDGGNTKLTVGSKTSRDGSDVISVNENAIQVFHNTGVAVTAFWSFTRTL